MGHAGHNCRSSFYKYMGVEGTLSHDLPSESDSEHVRGSESPSHGTVAMVLDLSYDPLRSVAGRPEEARSRFLFPGL